jgi:hypothetical protein
MGAPFSLHRFASNAWFNASTLEAPSRLIGWWHEQIRAASVQSSSLAHAVSEKARSSALAMPAHVEGIGPR